MAASVPVVPMDRGNNTTCTINLHGATIVSWRVNNQVGGRGGGGQLQGAGGAGRCTKRAPVPVVKIGINAS